MFQTTKTDLELSANSFDNRARVSPNDQQEHST